MTTATRAGRVTVVVSGRYDLARGIGAAETTFEMTRRTAARLKLGDVDELRTRTIYTDRAVYLNMPSWKGKTSRMWRRLGASELGVDIEAVGVRTFIFPALVEVLTQAEADQFRYRGDDRVVPVWLDGPEAFDALPTLLTRKLYDAGLESEELSSRVLAEVEIIEGRVVDVRADLGALLLEAERDAGLPESRAEVGDFAFHIALAGLGEPVEIKVPKRKDVFTADDVAAG